MEFDVSAFKRVEKMI